MAGAAPRKHKGKRAEQEAKSESKGDKRQEEERRTAGEQGLCGHAGHMLPVQGEQARESAVIESTIYFPFPRIEFNPISHKISIVHIFS